jgi:hypothetical protein
MQVKLQQWRGFWGIFGPRAAPELEFPADGSGSVQPSCSPGRIVKLRSSAVPEPLNFQGNEVEP